MSGILTPSQLQAKAAYSPLPSSVAEKTRKPSAVVFTALGLFAVLGVTVAFDPSSAGRALAAATILAVVFALAYRSEIETWQLITLSSVTGYVVLNYGFENLSLPVGSLRFLPLGELLMGAALLLAVRRQSGVEFRQSLRHPSMVCILALLLLTMVHLVSDVPQYGFYALRDATSSFEAVFLLLGMVWAARERNIELLSKWLMALFILTLVYAYTFPWTDQIQQWSPAFGPFHPVPLIGNYQEVALYLVSGALFCLWVAPTVYKWPRWTLVSLAVVQLAALGVLQSRTMLVGIGLVLVTLFFLRETTRMWQFFAIIASGLATLVLLVVLIAAVGWKVQGRLGPVNMASLENDVRSIWPSTAESQQLGHESDRKVWYGEVWNKLQSSPSHLLFGVGYGLPLIDFISETGQPIRQPHNSSMNVFGRLGLLGLSIWVLFVAGLLKRLWQGVREAVQRGAVSCPLRLWLLAFAILGLLVSMVQPYFEFSHSAIPFYFLMGVALGINPRETAKRAVVPLRPLRVSVRAPERDVLRRLPW
jgi:O-antigen ligase